MKKKNRKRIEEQLTEMEKTLANAEEYVAKNENVEGKSFFHFDDWKGKSGHPAWMKNHMIPTLKRARKRKEKLIQTIDIKTKDKKLTERKRQSNATTDPE